MTDPIVKRQRVNCSAGQAFEVFVSRISAWWPLEEHAASAADGKAAQAVTFEPRVGGRLYETMHDGRINEWGEVLVFEPGRRFATSWHPGNNKDEPTRLEVEFAEGEDGTCEVTLTHSGWEIWADRAAEMRENYNNGWDFVFGQRFVAGCGDVE